MTDTYVFRALSQLHQDAREDMGNHEGVKLQRVVKEQVPIVVSGLGPGTEQP